MVKKGIVRMGVKQHRFDAGATRQGYTSVLNFLEDLFDGEIQSELPKVVASRILRSVVSLASFDVDATFFACTGFVTKCNASSATIVTSASLVRAFWRCSQD